MVLNEAQQIASAMGFNILVIIVNETPVDAIPNGQLSYCHIVAQNLYLKAAGLFRLLQQYDASCLFIGGGHIIGDEIQTAKN